MDTGWRYWYSSVEVISRLPRSLGVQRFSYLKFHPTKLTFRTYQENTVNENTQNVSGSYTFQNEQVGLGSFRREIDKLTTYINKHTTLT